jgi:hypothetical protein
MQNRVSCDNAEIVTMQMGIKMQQRWQQNIKYNKTPLEAEKYIIK